AGAKGARLVLVGRDGARAAEVAATLQASGLEALGHGLDARDGEALNALLDTLGPIDHAISMLGGAMGGGFLSADPAQIRSTIEGKLFDNLALARVLTPRLQEGGSLTVTGGSGGRPDNASGAYIGNIGIAALVRGLAVELAPGIRVNAVAPTWTPTGLWRDVARSDVEATAAQFAGLIPLGRVAQVEEVAMAYLFLMECTFITGQTLTVDGGLTLIH
ncbi:MAG TPA: SDR family oxidoreductase, partial [Novosphingobium sp.]|nr:SDR family oxidoreductase [Novosphingobium sp.]